MPSSSPIAGHAIQREELARDQESGNIAHAYLFVGPAHVGKFTVARWFAGQLLADGLEGDARDEALDRIERLLHPDLLVLDQLWIEDLCEDWDTIAQSSNVPQQHRAKAGTRTDTIGIDDVRVLQERLHETGIGRYTCCCIRNIERMQDPAANALLKILEEPPPGRVFLLTTSSLANVLPTVVSRSRVLRFNHLPERELLPLVANSDEDDRHFLLHLAQGAPGILVRLRDDPDQLRAERLLHTRALSVYQSSSIAERLKLLEPLRQRGSESERLLLHLGLVLREHRPADPLRAARAYGELVSGLSTNAQRDILTQRFALAV